MHYRIIIGILLLSLFSSCIKELDGPNTLAPQDPPKYGRIVVYIDWSQFFDTVCSGKVDVLLDNEPIDDTGHQKGDSFGVGPGMY